MLAWSFSPVIAARQPAASATVRESAGATTQPEASAQMRLTDQLASSDAARHDAGTPKNHGAKASPFVF
jgi:hypothetical protein